MYDRPNTGRGIRLFLACLLSSSISSESHFIHHLSFAAISINHNQARDERTKYGHDVAVPLYQSLLRDHPDLTAATRIAAASLSPWRHDQACPIPQSLEYPVALHEDVEHSTNNTPSKEIEDTKIRGAISDLKQILEQSSFNNEQVQRLFGISPCGNDEQHNSGEDRSKMLSFSQGPVYIKPVRAGEQVSLPFALDELDGNGNERLGDNNSSLKCLVTLFLLGFAVPKAILSKGLIGGDNTIALLEYLGLAFYCEIDPLMIVPYVHLFPMDVNLVEKIQKPESSDTNMLDQRDNLIRKKPRKKSVVFVTDCHPTVLSRTTVGEMEDGAVMYIGPDSLALVQHIPLQTHMAHTCKEDYALHVHKSGTISSQPFKILDFCSGSGVQALSTLVSLEDVKEDAIAVCVDVNDRALRFARFNALLNGISDHRITTIKADLIRGKLLKQQQHVNAKVGMLNRRNHSDICESNEIDLLKTLLGLKLQGESQSVFDIILANPPFIPVPPSQNINVQNDINVSPTMQVRNSIMKRYGLFSSGGASGEDVLNSIMEMSSRLIRKNGGLLAIVSEFMNPPPVERETDASHDNDDHNLLERMECWWNLEMMSSSDPREKTLARGKGILFTNQFPVSAATYATRRADNEAEFKVWFDHLQSKDIHSVSPGLMFVRTRDIKHNNFTPQKNGIEQGRYEQGYLSLSHRIVPRTESGSVWTPSNVEAVDFTAGEWLEAISGSD